MPQSSLKHKKILITCGPTWVPIDDMRVISNRSTGQLGQMLAKRLHDEGAKVTLLEGPVLKPLAEEGIKVVKFQFYNELAGLINVECRKRYHAVIHAAAVSDYQPAKAQTSKIRSGQKGLKLKLKPTRKIIKSIKRLAPETLLVGFKLESRLTARDLKRIAAAMSVQARCDLILANTSGIKSYNGYIMNKHGEVLAHKDSRTKITRSLVSVLKKHL